MNFGVIVGKPIKLADGNLFLVRVKDPKHNAALDVSNQIAKLSPLVKEARPDFINLTYIGHGVPNDPYFAQQWALERIGALGAWDISTGSTNVVIAIIDSGCDLNHEDLSAKYVPPADRYNVIDETNRNNPSDVFGHGTCLAGIAAAQSDNRTGVTGVDRNCKIMPIKIYEDSWTDEHGAVRAIDWAIDHDANVINMSWGWPPPNNLIASMLDRAYDENIVLVASAGNYYLPGDPQTPIEFPASHRSVIAVGASDQDDKRKSFTSSDGQCWGSKFGRGLNVMAPGVLVMTTDLSGQVGFNDQTGVQIFPNLCVNPPYGPDNNYCSVMGGTSGAAAFVSGLAALLFFAAP